MTWQLKTCHLQVSSCQWHFKFAVLQCQLQLCFDSFFQTFLFSIIYSVFLRKSFYEMHSYVVQVSLQIELIFENMFISAQVKKTKISFYINLLLLQSKKVACVLIYSYYHYVILIYHSLIEIDVQYRHTVWLFNNKVASSVNG